MRITFVLPGLGSGGGQRVVATYAERLMRRGHDVVLVAPQPRRPTARAVVGSLVRGRGWPRARAYDTAFLEGTGVTHRIAARPGPMTNADVPDGDVVIATFWITAEWVATLAPRKGAKVYFVQGFESYPHMPVDRLEATWSLPFPKIAVSRWLVDLARERFADPYASLVPNSVDPGLFHAPPRSRNASPVVGMVYSSAHFRGCDVSLEAFERCRRKIPGLRLVAFGHRPPDPQLPLPPGTEYHTQPAQHALRTLYARCDAWLFGSRSEGFGLPILEAMACRTPVIGTPAGAAPEILADGGGILVRPEDPDDMARAIERVVGLPEAEWIAMSDAAHATATRYTWEDATDRFEQALELASERVARGEIAGGAPRAASPA